MQRPEVWAAAFSPDGGTLATAGDDGRIRPVAHQNVDKTENAARTRQPGEQPAFTPDGKRLASLEPPRSAQVMGRENGEASGGLFADCRIIGLRRLAISPDGKRIAATIEPAVLHRKSYSRCIN